MELLLQLAVGVLLSVVSQVAELIQKELYQPCGQHGLLGVVLATINSTNKSHSN